MDHVYSVGDDRGIILGTLFRRNSDICDDSSSAVAALSKAESDLIAQRGPTQLIDAYWGWYVAFLANPRARSRQVLRGPMSDFPCLMANFQSVTVFASRAEDCAALSAFQFRINRSMVQLAVGLGQIGATGQSAMDGLAVIDGGEAVEFGDGPPTKRRHWDPCKIAQLDPLDELSTISRSLRATVRSCVHAWAAHHPGIVVRASGGFDSSLVLQCLVDAPSRPSLTGLNYYWDKRETDERAYARSIATHTGVPLVETRFGTTVHLDVVRNVRLTAAPVLDVLDWQQALSDRALLRERGATAIFMGSLGDAIFARDIPRSSLLEYFRLHGANLGFFKIAMDLAMNESVSIWEVFRATSSDCLTRRRRHNWNLHDELLRAGALSARQILVKDVDREAFCANFRRFTHPWFRNVQGVPAGKLWQIAALTTEGFYDAHRRDDDPPIIAPFLSQPLVELCLRIPSYWNVWRGADRAMARYAFANELPTMILRRTGKGSPGGWLKAMIERDRHFVREFLLDGLMIKEGIVDASKLEKALPGTISHVASHGGGVMNLLYTEAWMRKWAAATTRTTETKCYDG